MHVCVCKLCQESEWKEMSENIVLLEQKKKSKETRQEECKKRMCIRKWAINAE